ncbi:MAG: hypothetical protein IJ347_05105 [Faecalibacterium sp.]|nr:hypothetical protein [Faecalibacterium sp.]
MIWVLLSFLPPIVGAFLLPRFRPQRRGKVKPLRAFTLSYPSRMVNCVAFIAFGMVGVVGAAAYFDMAAVQAAAFYYAVYVILAGFVMSAAMLLGRRAISFDGEKIRVTKKLFGKPEELSAADLYRLDVRKTEVRVLKEDGSLMFSAGVMMENLDMFFAWTHARPNIKLTVDGKEMPKKGAKK